MKILNTLLVLLAIHSGHTKADPLATHGMLLFGKTETYVSHLPMFHKPHDYQVILKVSLSDVGHSPIVQKYEMLKASGEEFFTIEPDPMDLTKVISGEITTFQANIYHGHFERDGLELGPVMFQVVKTIKANKLNPTAPETSEYLLFGENGEYFAAHVIGGKPSFDMILSIGQPFFDRHALVPVADQDLPTTVKFNGDKPAASSQLGSTGAVAAEVLKVLYVEEGELSH